MLEPERCQYMVPPFRAMGKTIIEERICGRLLSDLCGICKEYDRYKDEWAIGEKYAEALARNYRDNKFTLNAHILLGWTYEQHRHWVETGEEP
jgi:hypothetical protein